MTQYLQTYPFNSWSENFSSDIQNQAINALENGQLIFFPQLNFQLQENEHALSSLKLVDPKTKNISFNIKTGELRGAQAEQDKLKNMLERFALSASQLVNNLLPHYQNNLIQARTSFRPVEVKGRVTSYRKDDKRLHVDAFPSSPNQGRRILRVFSNINPNGEDRIWRVGEPFVNVAARFAPYIRKPFPGSRKLLQLLGITKSYRTLYDHFMLHIHDNMKADEIYQQKVEQAVIKFPPNSTWIVCTDQVSHAAMSGQHMLEQTFYLPVTAMLDPNCSPLRVLEKVLGYSLV